MTDQRCLKRRQERKELPLKFAAGETVLRSLAKAGHEDRSESQGSGQRFCKAGHPSVQRQRGVACEPKHCCGEKPKQEEGQQEKHHQHLKFLLSL